MFAKLKSRELNLRFPISTDKYMGWFSESISIKSNPKPSQNPTQGQHQFYGQYFVFNGHYIIWTKSNFKNSLGPNMTREKLAWARRDGQSLLWLKRSCSFQQEQSFNSSTCSRWYKIDWSALSIVQYPPKGKNHQNVHISQYLYIFSIFD